MPLGGKLLRVAGFQYLSRMPDPGLGFYSAMGFEDTDREPAVPLCDGTPVDRVTKLLRL